MDSASRNFSWILDMFDLRQCMTEPTHDLGRLLDAVIVPSDFEPAEIKINETCLSDHKMVFWTTQIMCPLQSSRL